MSIVKDLLLIILFVIMLLKYISLYKFCLKQRELFIETLSHDLRVATIAQIRGLELLEKNNSGVVLKDLIQEINNSCKFSLDMICMLLNTYKYEKGEQVLNCKNLPLLESVKSVLAKTVKLKKQVKIQYAISSDLNIYADKIEIEKLLSTLLSIAIENAESEETICITSKSYCSHVETSILFKGRFLTDEEQRRMFAKNPRFSTVGHGIKLQLCKKIIDFHKGKISTTHLGGNLNVFTFSLPQGKKESLTKIHAFTQLKLSNLL